MKLRGQKIGVPISPINCHASLLRENRFGGNAVQKTAERHFFFLKRSGNQ